VASGAQVARSARLEASDGGSIVLEEGCVVGDGCRLLARGGAVRIGAGAMLGERCTLVAHAAVTLGEGAVLGDGAMAIDFDHETIDVERPVRLQGIEAAPVTIGARAQLGPGASVLRGVTVGESARIGAHAVVGNDVPPGVTVAGVPAREGT